MTYILPQVQVFQEFRQVPTTVIKNLNAFVFGPQYQLFRYDVASEKELIGLGAYVSGASTPYAYPSMPAGASVDQEFCKLYMENVWAEYCAIPATGASPVNVVSPDELNKLRASPVIADVSNNGVVHAKLDTAGTKGWFQGHVSLPEYYYFYPVGGADGSGDYDATAVTANISAEDAVLNYITSEGLAGTVDIPAGATTSGVFVPGPDGLQLDFDAGSVNSTLEAPMNVVLWNDDTVDTFATLVAVKASKLPDVIDNLLDAAVPNPPKIVIANGAADCTWSNATRTLTLTLTKLTTTFEALSTVVALVFAAGGNTCSQYFDFTASVSMKAITNVLMSELIAADGGIAIPAGPTDIVRDCFRLRVASNPYCFATGNGVNHSTQFRTRGVKVGDRVRYSVLDGSMVTHTGTSKVVGFEADKTLASIAQATAKSTNQITQAADDLASVVKIVTYGADNQRKFNGTNTGILALDSVVQRYTGDYSNGLVADTFTVTITTSGVAGVALATVSNASGTYLRTNVPIQVNGANDGQIYLGRNVIIDFDKGGSDADAVFQVGDTYTLNRTVKAPFTAIAAGTAVLSGGTYDGIADTTYLVEVVRGGTFERDANVIIGIANAAATVLTATVVDATWIGGDNDDEYILKCTTGGLIVAAQFSLTSQRGDNATGINFGAIASDIALGGYGLTAKFSADVTFVAGQYWVIKVNASRPQIKIYDSAGIDEGSYDVVNYAVQANLGVMGATIEFTANLDREGFVANGGLIKGDVFYVDCSASVDGALRTIVLSDDLPAAVTTGKDSSGDSNPAPSNVAVWLYLVQSSTEIRRKMLQSPPDYNWETSATVLTVNPAIAVQDASWGTDYLAVYAADLYLNYRALVGTFADTIRLMTDIGDVETTFGTISPENPIAQGMYDALSNSGNRGVYYMTVRTDDLAGYLRALDIATLNSDVYAFAPMTSDLDILNAVEAHINEQSSETEKHWRIGFVSAKMPVIAAVYDKATNPRTEEFYATIVQDPLVLTPSFTYLTFTESDGDPSPFTKATEGLIPGDKIRINYSTDAWGDPTYAEYEIASVVSNTVVRLESGPSASVPLPVKVEAWHPLSVQEMAGAVAAVSSRFSSRRIYNCFPNTLGAFGVLVPGYMGAAAAAGLCSSVAPQQGLTNIELNGFDDLPMVYSVFSRSQLNIMAAGGTLILMQDVAGGRIYIRHQLSTATAENNINTRELSVTKNLDSISFYFADRLAPYIGRYNITPELLTVLRTQIDDGLLYLGSFTSVGLLGPQVILDNTQVRTLQQHPTLKDTVIAIVDLQLPYPLNVIELHLVV